MTFLNYILIEKNHIASDTSPFNVITVKELRKLQKNKWIFPGISTAEKVTA